MMTIEKVTDQKQQVTDAQVIKLLSDIGVDKDFVEFHDYDRTRPYAKEYVDRKSNLRVQVISNLPMCRKDDGSKTVAGWERSGDSYFNKNNLFEAELTGSRLALSVTNNQPSGVTTSDELVWNPQLFIGGEEVKLLSSAILETDPTNENYHDNVIAFDYGHGITRYLRIIEGRMREWWEFTERPAGEVRVKHNQQGGAFLRLGHGISGLVPLDIAVENGDEEILHNIDYQLPFTIGATSTFYPDAHPESATVDGYVERTTSGTWSQIRTGAGTGHGDDSDGSAYNCGFYKKTSDTTTYEAMRRIIILFDTSSLSDTDIITGVTLSTYYYSTWYATAQPFAICSSNPASNTDLVNADYNYSLFGSTVYAIGVPEATGSNYCDFNFLSSAYSAINKTGITKLGMRHYFDVVNHDPAFGSTSYIAYGGIYLYGVRMSEAGSSYKPKLVVTTETPSGGREPRGLYHGV